MSEKDMFGELPVPKTWRASKPTVRTRSSLSWFFALRPSADEAQHIFALAETLLISNGISGSRITPDRLHITLEWIGDDIGGDVVERACLAANTIHFPAVEAVFNAAKTFPAPSGPFVLLGNEGLDEIRRLRGELARALAERSFKPPRAYEPHMTLCYDRVHRLARTSIEPIGFRTAEFALVKSYVRLSRHEVVRSWPLRNRMS